MECFKNENKHLMNSLYKLTFICNIIFYLMMQNRKKFFLQYLKIGILKSSLLTKHCKCKTLHCTQYKILNTKINLRDIMMTY